MSVGGIGRGGGKGKAGGAKGASGAAGKAPAGKASGSGFGAKVDGSAGLVGASGLAGSGNVGSADPISSHAKVIAQKLKSGEIKSKEDATRSLVAEVLKEKLKMKSKALEAKITEALLDDPNLHQKLERLWNKASE